VTNEYLTKVHLEWISKHEKQRLSLLQPRSLSTSCDPIDAGRPAPQTCDYFAHVWSKSKLCIYWIFVLFSFSLYCHRQEEIFSDRGSVVAPKILSWKVSRVTMINNKTKCLVVLCKPENIEALGKPLYLGPKSFIRTVTDSSKPHLPLSNFSLARGCHFLALFIWREHNAGSFLNGLTWSLSMMETFCGFGGTLTSLVVFDSCKINNIHFVVVVQR